MVRLDRACGILLSVKGLMPTTAGLSRGEGRYLMIASISSCIPLFSRTADHRRYPVFEGCLAESSDNIIFTD